MLFEVEAEKSVCTDEPISTIDSVAQNIILPTEYRIKRVSNGYMVFPQNHTQDFYARVFVNYKEATKYIDKHLNELEEQIKIEKLKQ